jgi:hypothetical protein
MVRLSRCQSSQFAGDTDPREASGSPLPPPVSHFSYTVTRRSPSGYGSGLNSS